MRDYKRFFQWMSLFFEVSYVGMFDHVLPTSHHQRETLLVPKWYFQYNVNCNFDVNPKNLLVTFLICCYFCDFFCYQAGWYLLLSMKSKSLHVFSEKNFTCNFFSRINILHVICCVFLFLFTMYL